ncbi:MAG: hypothetical protein AAFY65_01265 [Pseudomonadota bacterium]
MSDDRVAMSQMAPHPDVNDSIDKLCRSIRACEILSPDATQTLTVGASVAREIRHRLQRSEPGPDGVRARQDRQVWARTMGRVEGLAVGVATCAVVMLAWSVVWWLL